jgi:hypothetical protein
VVNQGDVQMPCDWNDHAGWDQFYQAQVERPPNGRWDLEVGSIHVQQLPKLAGSLKAQGWRSVWIPGCGLSPLPHVLAHLGLNVVATDVSQVAIRFHRDGLDRFAGLTNTLAPLDPAGSLTVEVHDFRSEYRQEEFDLIINVKAFQGFSFSETRWIAGVHARALRKGRHAYFDTMNVQGERRDELEQSLEDGGFLVPLSGLNRWYRRELLDTGIPHLFILGQPVVPRTGEYADGGPMWERDMARLREVSAQYRSRLQAEKEAEQRRIGPDAKVAQVIYSTG